MSLSSYTDIEFDSDDYDLEDSISESDYEEYEDYKNGDQTEERLDEIKNMLDLSPLFSDTLLTIASKFQKNPIATPLQRHYKEINDWLLMKYIIDTVRCDVVLLHQFKWMLGSLGVTEDVAVKIFHMFDSQDAKSCLTSAVTQFLKLFSGTHLIGSNIISRNIYRLQSSLLMPGLVDIYQLQTTNTTELLSNMHQFLKVNRVHCDQLPFPVLQGYSNKQQLRLAIVAEVIKHRQADIFGEASEYRITKNSKVIKKCIRNIEVSSNKANVSLLTNKDDHSYWQSDGFDKVHWIRLHIKPDIIISQLSVTVFEKDLSFLPELIGVSVGPSVNNMREVKETWISPSHNGPAVVAEAFDTYYPLVQINIKHSHSGGSDTRIHQVTAHGYRRATSESERKPSVTDTVQVWYLQVMSALMATAIPNAPALRDMVLKHTQNALEKITPLSLCPASPSGRAPFGSDVLKQMGEFISDLSLSVENAVVDVGFRCQLLFNLARGCINGLLGNLHQLLSMSTAPFDMERLFSDMISVRDRFIEEHAKRISLSLFGCDGGTLNQSSGPENVISATRVQSNLYMTEEGVTKVNMIFMATDLIQVTKLKIKVSAGDRAPKMGFVFIYPESENYLDIEEHIERFEQYDEWTIDKYNSCSANRSDGSEDQATFPVACFSFENSDEVVVPVPSLAIGKYVLVKFIKARVESSSHLEIAYVRFYGHQRSDIYSSFKMQPPCAGGSMSPKHLVHTCLCFMLEICSTQLTDGPDLFKLQGLDLNSNPLDALWTLYSRVVSENVGEGESDWSSTRLLVLYLMSHLSHFYDWHHHTAQESCLALRVHLCELVDTPGEDTDSKLLVIARKLLTERPEMFYPNTDLRREQLFASLDKLSIDVCVTDIVIQTQGESQSDNLIVKGLCHYFTTSHPRALLASLTLSHNDDDTAAIFTMLHSLYTVCVDELRRTVETSLSADHHRPLIQLLSTLQTGLLTWAIKQLTYSDDEIDSVSRIVDKYIHIVTDYSLKCFQFLRTLSADELVSLPMTEVAENQANFRTIIVLYTIISILREIFTVEKSQKKPIPLPEDLAVSVLDHGIIPTVLNQLLLYIMTLVKHVNHSTQMSILKSLRAVDDEVSLLSEMLPELFLQADDDEWLSMTSEDTVLQEWEEESPHPIPMGFKKNREYTCPGATHFEVTFDSKSEIDTSSDTMDFHTSLDVKQHVDFLKKPRVMVFNGGHKLSFKFVSAEGSQKWGYKFKVDAKGPADIDLMEWPLDTQLTMAKALGHICSIILSRQKFNVLTSDTDGDILTSELWTTLFRGGYLVGKVQRTLSGKITTEDDMLTNTFLWDMVNGQDGHAAEFLASVKDKATKSNMPCMKNVDDTITAIYSAILWHTQQLRGDVKAYALARRNDECIGRSLVSAPAVITDGLVDAYNVAESFRINIMAQQQKWRSSVTDLDVVDETQSPLDLCKKKALYLRKFAGLTHVQMRSEMKQKMNRQKKSLSMEHLRSTKSDQDIAVLDKYPSIRMVVDFINDPAWTGDRVHSILQERWTKAQSHTQVYGFASKYLKPPTQHTYMQLSGVVFLRELSLHDDTQPRHYADGLDGCGLELETDLRQAYYGLVGTLMSLVRDTQSCGDQNASVRALHDFLQSTTLHFIDIPWQNYDLSFLLSADLPHFYMNIIKDSLLEQTVMTADAPDRIKELDVLNRHAMWLVNTTGERKFTTWYDNIRAKVTDRKDLQMFIAKYSDVLDVDIFCDGCEASLSGRRYRCLQCEDVDLCATCFATGMTPEEHTSEHDMIHLAYQCNNCSSFIVGTRISCQTCEDFDLCLGCYTNKDYPSGHTEEHAVDEHTITKLHTSSSKPLLQTYNEQRAWLQLAALLTRLVQVAYKQDDCDSVDDEYHETSVTIHGLCVSRLIEMLTQASRHRHPDDRVDRGNLGERRQFEDLMLPSQEKIMGLFGILVPPHPNMSVRPQSLSLTLLMDVLLSMSSDSSSVDVITRHMALSLLSRLIIQSTTQVCDDTVSQRHATLMATGKETNGGVTVSYLFHLGATYLTSGRLEFVSTLVHLTQQLFASPEWSVAVNQQISQVLADLSKIKDEVLTFALFVIAGFPELLTRGTVVKYDNNDALVVEHYYTNSATLVINTAARVKLKVEENELTHIATPVSLPSDTSIMQTIVSHIKHYIGLLKTDEMKILMIIVIRTKQPIVLVHRCAAYQDKPLKLWQVIAEDVNKSHKDKQNVEPLDEPLMLRLVWYLKVIGRLLATDSNPSLCDDDFIKAIVFLASLDTEFSPKRLNELEVYCLVMIPSKNKSSSEDMKKGTVGHDLPTPLGTSVPIAAEETSESADADHNDRRSDDDKGSLIPAGFTKMSCEVSHFTSAENKLSYPSKVRPEQVDVAENLMGWETNERQWGDSQSVESSKGTKKSLIKDALARRMETLAATCVLRCRSILFHLLSDLPVSGEVICTELLGYTDTRQVLCVLDLLSYSVSRQSFHKVLQKLFEASPKENIEMFMSTACQFLRSHVISVYTLKSSERPESQAYHIHCPQATLLRVNFHKSCSLDTDDKLVLEGPDSESNMHSFTGSGPWNEVTIPGNTMNITYTCAHSAHKSWGYQFTVTAICSDRFDISYVFLTTLLDRHVCKLSVLNEIWHEVIYIACMETGKTFLQCISLLLKILAIYLRGAYSKTELVNLSLLQPLWRLFCQSELRGDVTPDKTQSPIIRALSELFCMAETLVLNYGIATEYLISLRDSDDLSHALLLGLCHIAEVSRAIGVTNLATVCLPCSNSTKGTPSYTNVTVNTTTNKKVV